MGRIRTALQLLMTNPRMFLAQLVLQYNFLFKNDELYLRLLFRLWVGYPLNLNNPRTFNQKLQWLKLYDRKDIYTTMVDKFLAKEYVANLIGSEYIIPSIGVWNNPDEIEWNLLPPQFVLKTNHDGGGSGIIICKDKSKFDVTKAKQKLEKSLKTDIYHELREWPYKNVRRRVFAEKYLSENDTSELLDYKVMCFNGVAKIIQVHKGRFHNQTQDLYDTKWHYLNYYQPDVKRSNEEIPKPLVLGKMLTLSEVLSTNIPFLRVDWYIVDNHLYFGELTFYDASGFDEFEPQEYNYILGEWINLPQKNIRE